MNMNNATWLVYETAQGQFEYVPFYGDTDSPEEIKAAIEGELMEICGTKDAAKRSVAACYKLALDKSRRELIERLFTHYDFEPDAVAQVNGWQHDSPDEYRRTIFLDGRDDGPSRYAIFSVTFRPGSDEVLHYGL